MIWCRGVRIFSALVRSHRRMLEHRLSRPYDERVSLRLDRTLALEELLQADRSDYAQSNTEAS